MKYFLLKPLQKICKSLVKRPAQLEYITQRQVDDNRRMKTTLVIELQTNPEECGQSRRKCEVTVLTLTSHQRDLLNYCFHKFVQSTSHPLSLATFSPNLKSSITFMLCFHDFFSSSLFPFGFRPINEQFLGH